MESGKIPTAPCFSFSCFNKQTFDLDLSHFSLITVCHSTLKERQGEKKKKLNKKRLDVFVRVLSHHMTFIMP